MKSHQKSISRPQRNNIRRRRKKQSSKPINSGGESSLPILPIDSITEIISRLPAKFITRFRCVSKLWESILGGPCPYIRELFLTNSSSRPQILFAFPKFNEVFFFTIPQLQNLDRELSSVVATFVTKLPFVDPLALIYPLQRYSHSNGLVVLREKWRSSPSSNRLAMVCNPSTRQSLSIPNVTWRSRYFLGYDPIEKQYKLLSINLKSYQVITLGSENLLWRDILCSTEHYTVCDGICINGVIYYRAAVNESSKVTMVVSFDIRSEEFHFMEVMENFRAVQSEATLINYNGKLGSLIADIFCYVDGTTKAFEMWILEDPKKQEWSKHTHQLPRLRKNLDGMCSYIVGVIGTYIMLSQSSYGYGSYYIMYYNMKTKRVFQVEIKGMETCRGGRVFTSLNYVEDLKLIQPI